MHELRRRLANAVLHGARRGLRDPDRLKADALRTVAATLTDLEDTAQAA